MSLQIRTIPLPVFQAVPVGRTRKPALLLFRLLPRYFSHGHEVRFLHLFHFPYFLPLPSPWKIPYKINRNQTHTLLFPVRMSQNNGSRHRYLPHKYFLSYFQNGPLPGNQKVSPRSYPSVFRMVSLCPITDLQRRSRLPYHPARCKESL